MPASSSSSSSSSTGGSPSPETLHPELRMPTQQPQATQQQHAHAHAYPQGQHGWYPFPQACYYQGAAPQYPQQAVGSAFAAPPQQQQSASSSQAAPQQQAYQRQAHNPQQHVPPQRTQSTAAPVQGAYSDALAWGMTQCIANQAEMLQRLAANEQAIGTQDTVRATAEALKEAAKALQGRPQNRSSPPARRDRRSRRRVSRSRRRSRSRPRQSRRQRSRTLQRQSPRRDREPAGETQASQERSAAPERPATAARPTTPSTAPCGSREQPPPQQPPTATDRQVLLTPSTASPKDQALDARSDAMRRARERAQTDPIWLSWQSTKHRQIRDNASTVSMHAAAIQDMHYWQAHLSRKETALNEAQEEYDSASSMPHAAHRHAALDRLTLAHDDRDYAAQELQKAETTRTARAKAITQPYAGPMVPPGYRQAPLAQPKQVPKPSIIDRTRNCATQGAARRLNPAERYPQLPEWNDGQPGTLRIAAAPYRHPRDEFYWKHSASSYRPRMDSRPAYVHNAPSGQRSYWEDNQAPRRGNQRWRPRQDREAETADPSNNHRPHRRARGGRDRRRNTEDQAGRPRREPAATASNAAEEADSPAAAAPAEIEEADDKAPDDARRHAEEVVRSPSTPGSKVDFGTDDPSAAQQMKPDELMPPATE